MSYDPRAGANPYLGLADDEDMLSDQAFEPETVRASDVARAPETVRQASAGETAGAASAPARAPQMAPATVRRPQPRRGVAPAAGGTAVIRRQPVTPAVSPAQSRRQVVAAPPQAPRARRGGAFGFIASLGLRLLSLAARVAALVLSALVVVASFGANQHRALIVRLLNGASAFVPAGLAGRLVVETPFGGAFRGDLALFAIIFFVIDWVCLRYAVSLAAGRERGV